MNGSVLSGFLEIRYNFWDVGENPKVFDKKIDDKSEKCTETSRNFKKSFDFQYVGWFLKQITDPCRFVLDIKPKGTE